MKNKPLTPDEKKFIRDNRFKETPRVLAVIMGRDESTIRSHMKYKKIKPLLIKKQSVNYLKEPGE